MYVWWSAYLCVLTVLIFSTDFTLYSYQEDFIQRFLKKYEKKLRRLCLSLTDCCCCIFSFFFLFGDTPPSKNIPYEDHVRADNFNRLISVKLSKFVEVEIWYITSVLFNWSIYFTVLSMIGWSNMCKTVHDITMHGILLVMLVYLQRGEYKEMNITNI